jgi:Ni/Fe-hydrogenase subunit HybB-like protein
MMKTRHIMKRVTFWRSVFVLLLGLGLYTTYVRFTEGLGAVTNLSDEFPWGLWIGFDILCGVGLAAGGFTIAATVYIFNIKRFRPILRPTILTAFLGYVLVIVALMYDLGRPDRIWHAIIMWNPHSVMFEVAWCVMLYTTVLALEFSPVVFERLGWEKPLKWIKGVTVPLVIVGVLLSTLHQSSLGSLYLIVPGKLYGLWYSPILPVFFFISAIAAGCAMTIFESFMSFRAFGKRLETDLLRDLGRVVLVVLLAYLVLRVGDLLYQGKISLLWQPRLELYLYYLEMIIGVLLPIALLSIRKLRGNYNILFFSALFVILGFVLDRLNVSITGMAASSGVAYFPSWMEISVTMLIVALGFGVFALAVKNLRIFTETEEPKSSGIGHVRVHETAPVQESVSPYSSNVSIGH